MSEYNYGNKFNRSEINKTKILLTNKNEQIDFDFIQKIMSTIELEKITKVKNYLKDKALDNYNLSAQETKALENYKDLKWGSFNVKTLFGDSTRGKRLRGEDRIPGELPFVTAGEKNEGVSDFIGNDVNVFPENTTTIDMFGSAKYRSYKYGGDDHITVVHTENLTKYASIFVKTAIHNSSGNGEFNYGRNFYPKDADVLNISLPVKDNAPDYEVMITIVSAIHKLVIKDVVLYVQRKISKR